MVAARDDDHVVCPGHIDQSMLVVNSSGPTPSQIPFERFGLADTVKWLAEYFLNQLVDSLAEFAVMVLKPLIILPCRRSESQIHSGLNSCFRA